MPDSSNQLPPDRQVPGSPGAAPGVSAPANGVDAGEYISVGMDTSGFQLTHTEDGGAFVEMPGQSSESTPADPEFYDNLAEVLPQRVRNMLAADLTRKIEADKTARKKRDEQYEEGVRRTGMGNDAPGGADFTGASRVVHPMMTEACIDYESRIIKELWPPSGPVKPHILGVPTAQKLDKAKRIADHMNYQLTQQMPEARAVLEETLTQVPLGGSQFIRQWWDHRLKRPRWEFVPIDKVYVPFGASSADSAHRITYAETIDSIEFKRRVDQGMYRDIGNIGTSMSPEMSKTQQANQKIEGVDDSGENLDGAREVYETLATIEVTEEMAEAIGGDDPPNELYPFIFHIDVTTNELLGVFRAWEMGDTAREKICSLFEIPFIPWRGAYSVGFPQIIGGLSGAATGALRALLDSAHINNAAGGFILKGAGAGGQTRRGAIGEFTEIDGGLETDDIRKRVLPFATNQPSPVLLQLLGFVVEAANGIVRTSLDEGPNQGQTPVPVGTQMSRVEEGLVVFSAIHGRAHDAFNRILRGLHRLNRLYLPEYIKVDASGTELLVARKDYDGPCDAQPVSDPTIYSDQQRWAQLNYIQSRVAVAPTLWKAREVEMAGLKLIKWPNPETLLNDEAQPHELNQVNENLAMALGQPVRAFPEQDHMAHLEAIFDFMGSPALGMNPLIAPKYLPLALAHVAEHIVYLYVKTTVSTVTAAANKPIADLMSNDTKVKAMFDQLLAQASKTVVPDVAQQLQPYQQVMQAAMQMAQQMAPKPPVDPALAAVQAATAETQRKAAADQAGQQLDQSKHAADSNFQQQQIALKDKQIDADLEKARIAAETKAQTTAADNATAVQISDARLTAPGAGGGGLRDGQGITKG